MIWNEYACDCFSMIQCEIACFDGMELDPRSGCSCVDSRTLRQELYGDDWTEEKIRLAQEAEWNNFRES